MYNDLQASNKKPFDQKNPGKKLHLFMESVHLFGHILKDYKIKIIKSPGPLV